LHAEILATELVELRNGLTGLVDFAELQVGFSEEI